MDRRSVVQSLVSAILGGVVGAVLVGAMSSQPEPDTSVQMQVSSLTGRISRLESGVERRLAYLENQDRLAVQNALAVNDAIQAITRTTGLLTTASTEPIYAFEVQAPAGCWGKAAVWKPGLGLYC